MHPLFHRPSHPLFRDHNVFPEVLEEIRGLAEGQQCDCGALSAVLLSMYAIPPACNCSCFAAAGDAHILLGRNSDFLTVLEKLNTNVIYKFTNGAYSFTGNTTAFTDFCASTTGRPEWTPSGRYSTI